MQDRIMELLNISDDILIQLIELEVVVSDDYQCLEPILDQEDKEIRYATARHILMLDKVYDLKEAVDKLQDVIISEDTSQSNDPKTDAHDND